MKHLANCDPVEFFVQTNKIRKAVAEWLSLTKILEIRKKLPAYTDGMTENEKREAMQRQIKANARAMLDAMLDEHPKETAELLGLLCFVEPEDLKNHKMTEFFGALSELLNSREVIDFFTSLAQLESVDISGFVSQ